MTDYYKSLVTDDEVIAALIKESKTRMGLLAQESTRIRPNLNFFQRTVNHLVSSNKRINSKQAEFKQENSKSKPTERKQYKHEPPPGELKDTSSTKNRLWFEKIKFIKSYINQNSNQSTSVETDKGKNSSNGRKRKNSSSSSSSSSSSFSSSSSSSSDSDSKPKKAILRNSPSIISISSSGSDSSVEIVCVQRGKSKDNV